MYQETYKGKYKVKNPAKYRGDIHDVIYRSSWELKFMNWCDTTPAVLEWGSEIAVIPYISPVDKRVHRYFVDFYMKVQDKHGLIEKYLVEIKPKKFTEEPIKPKRVTKHFIEEVFTYGVNQAKWKAAREFCEDRKWKFVVLTEDELKIDGYRKKSF
jgi:hypothetical protein